MVQIFFDIDDTLYDQMVPFDRACRSVFAASYSRLDVEKLFVNSRARSDEVFRMVSRGEMEPGEMYAYRIQMAFVDCRSYISKQEAMAFQRAYAKNQAEITLQPGIVTLLDELASRKVAMGIITNGPGAHQMRKVKALGLEKWFDKDRIFISGEIGCAKPDVEIFRLVQEKTGVQAGEAVFVGDAFPIDVVGAKGAGWRSVWINRRKNPIPENTMVRPDFAAEDDGALEKIIMAIIGR